MKLRPFELGLVVFFSIAVFVAFFLFNNYSGKSEKDPVSAGLGLGVTVWGTVPGNIFTTLISEIDKVTPNFNKVSYRYIPQKDFEQTFINALADQKSPDLLFIPHEELVSLRGRLQVIPYESFPLRDFMNIYVEGASIFALSDGIYAYPVAVDPLVMFWNKNILAENKFLSAPTTWEEVVNDLAPVTTIKDFNRVIKRGTLAMGEFSNIKNAFPVLSTLLLQAGSDFVTENRNVKSDQTLYEVNLNKSKIAGSAPLSNSLTFFTNFSNTNNTAYSWNRSLGLDRDMFLQENLALYFGFGSEGRELETKNPNLSFDIAEIPQGAGVVNKRTYGSFMGFVTPRAARNKAGAFIVAKTLADQKYSKRIADALNMAPVFKQPVLQGSNDVFGRVVYSSAINARGWLSPNLEKSNEAFKKAVEDLGSNRVGVSQATNDTTNRLKALYR